MNKQIEEKDKMYILNTILQEVKPLKLREKIYWRIVEFVNKKLPENSVVLTKEEYNLIDHNIKHLETVCNNLEKERDRLYEIKLDLENQLIEKGWTDYEGADEIEKRVRKETAREILHKIYEELSKYEAVNEIDYDCWVDDVLYEIAIQYGVEAEDT